MRNFRAVILSAVAVSLAVAGNNIPLHAQVKIPTLNGHRFVPARTVPDPFVATQFWSQLGAGLATSKEYPLFVFQGDTISAPRGEQIFAVIRMHYEQRIRKWLAAKVVLETIARTGSNAISLLGTGVTASTDLRFEWKITLLESKKTTLALDVGFRNQSTTYIDIGQFVEDIIGPGDPRLVQTVPSSRGILGGQIAFAPNPTLGLLASGVVLVGTSEVSREAETDVDLKLDAAVSLDGRHHGIPLGTLLGFSWSSASFDHKNPDEPMRSLELMIVYSEPEDFALGPSFAWVWMPGLDGREVSFASVVLSSRYFF